MTTNHRRRYRPALFFGGIYERVAPLIGAINGAVVVALITVISGCASLPERGTNTSRESAAGIEVERGRGWTLYAIDLERIRMAVWHLPATRRSTTADVIGGVDDRVDGAFLLAATTPWRIDGETRRSEGPLIAAGEVVVAAGGSGTSGVPRWSIGWNDDHRPVLVAPGTEASYENVAGGFFPLLADGEVVANRFPGSAERRARVAVGWSDRTLFVLAVDHAPARLRSGATVSETARFLADRGALFALNVDGGRSAFVATGAEVAPRVPFRRRVGPAGIVVYPSTTPPVVPVLQ